MRVTTGNHPHLLFLFFIIIISFITSQLSGPDVRACTSCWQACRHSSADTPWHHKHVVLIKRGVLMGAGGGGGVGGEEVEVPEISQRL